MLTGTWSRALLMGHIQADTGVPGTSGNPGGLPQLCVSPCI